MIRLICPSCSASYDVPDNAIPAHGRKVRCQLCGETWHQQPVEIDLVGDDDASAGFDQTSPEEFGELLRSVLEETDAPAQAAAGQSAAKTKATVSSTATQTPPKAGSGRSRAGWWAGIFSGCLVLGVYGVFGMLMPSHTPLWNDIIRSLTVLMPPSGDPADRLHNNLAFERIELIARETGGYALRGTIINLSAHEHTLPPLSIVWRDDQGNVLSTIPILLSVDRIPPEGQFPIDHTIEQPPEHAVSMDLVALAP